MVIFGRYWIFLEESSGVWRNAFLACEAGLRRLFFVKNFIFACESGLRRFFRVKKNKKAMKKISRRRRREAGLVSLGNGQVQNPSRAGAA